MPAVFAAVRRALRPGGRFMFNLAGGRFVFNLGGGFAGDLSVPRNHRVARMSAPSGQVR